MFYNENCGISLAIIWTNDSVIYWHIYASFGLNGLREGFWPICNLIVYKMEDFTHQSKSKATVYTNAPLGSRKLGLVLEQWTTKVTFKRWKYNVFSHWLRTYMAFDLTTFPLQNQKIIPVILSHCKLITRSRWAMYRLMLMKINRIKWQNRECV